MWMLSGNAFCTGSGAVESVIHLILVVYCPRFAAEGIRSTLKSPYVIKPSLSQVVQLYSFPPPSGSYPRLCEVEDGQPWTVTNAPGQVEVRSSRPSGEQGCFAVLEAGAVTVLSLDVAWQLSGPAFLRSCGFVC